MEGLKNFMVYVGLSILLIGGLTHYLFLQTYLENLVLLGEKSYLSGPIIEGGGSSESLSMVTGHQVLFQFIKKEEKEIIIQDAFGNEMKSFDAIKSAPGFLKSYAYDVHGKIKAIKYQEIKSWNH